MILAIDPGNEQSAFVVMGKDTYKPVEFGILPNLDLRAKLINLPDEWMQNSIVIEMVASYGMPVGKEVFDTVWWIGRFYEQAFNVTPSVALLYRQDEKLNLCHDSRAKDANIRQALIDRFGEVGTKKNPGWFYGFKADIWAAYAVGVTFADMLHGKYVCRK